MEKIRAGQLWYNEHNRTSLIPLRCVPYGTWDIWECFQVGHQTFVGGNSKGEKFKYDDEEIRSCFKLVKKGV